MKAIQSINFSGAAIFGAVLLLSALPSAAGTCSRVYDGTIQVGRPKKNSTILTSRAATETNHARRHPVIDKYKENICRTIAGRII